MNNPPTSRITRSQQETDDFQRAGWNIVGNLRSAGKQEMPEFAYERELRWPGPGLPVYPVNWPPADRT
jgi:hypothetical protein